MTLNGSVVFSALLILAAAVGPAAAREIVIEHMYFDVRQKFHRGAIDASQTPPAGFVQDSAGAVLTPVTAKTKCKGAGCPELDGVAIRITGSKWTSLEAKTLYVEETAGWYMLWLNEERTVPMVPSDEEIARVFDSNERGYLGAKNAGIIVIR
uniref:Uncharacterized protein n=1 Tax=Neobodo designis TaxID=312471 RepID=A0A7S1PZ59_NEODS|mmetsp:Transcript_251/g.983  ORF Transcript_251/g.983 Transcript_251/m.983 type:complete len:153 (+) Transcript_251:54-512(+)